jgi:putative endonuclease
MYYVYILKNSKDKRTYIGSTDNLKRRIHEHETGQCEFTKPLLPITLEAYFAVSSEVTARDLEKFLKCGSGRAFLKKRILSDEA